jgi:hypothetical protein
LHGRTLLARTLCCPAHLPGSHRRDTFLAVRHVCFWQLGTYASFVMGSCIRAEGFGNRPGVPAFVLAGLGHLRGGLARLGLACVRVGFGQDWLWAWAWAGLAALGLGVLGMGMAALALSSVVLLRSLAWLGPPCLEWLGLAWRNLRSAFQVRLGMKVWAAVSRHADGQRRACRPAYAGGRLGEQTLVFPSSGLACECGLAWLAERLSLRMPCAVLPVWACARLYCGEGERQAMSCDHCGRSRWAR